MKRDYRFSLSNAALQLALMALLLHAAVPVIQAQDRGRELRPAIQAEVTIARSEMRFRAPERVIGMRLEVFNQSGESVFDSGETTDHLLLWPMQDEKGKPLASGLYAYTMTLKTAEGEATHTQRGYLTVDLARDRQAQGDRFWVTSRNPVAADARAGEVIVTGDDDVTIVGVRTKESTRDGDWQGTTGNGQSAMRPKKSPLWAASMGDRKSVV